MQNSRLLRSAPLPLVVDVDGGLLACDPVLAGLRQMLPRRPAAVIPALRSSAAAQPFALQALLSEPRAPLPRLPVRGLALDAIRLWRRFGAPVVLISRLPEAMTAHLRDALCPGVRIIAARPSRPLDAAGKAAHLASVFGLRGFDLLAEARGSGRSAPMARRAMLAGLSLQGKRRLLTSGVQAAALPMHRHPEVTVQLRAGAGWREDWTGGAPEAVPAKPETRLPSRDASAAGHSRRDRAGRS